MQAFNDKEIAESIKVGAFVVVIGIIAVASLVAFSIIRDNRCQREAEERSKRREIPRVSSAEQRSRPRSIENTSED